MTIIAAAPADPSGTLPTLLDKLEQDAGEKTQSAKHIAEAEANRIDDPLLTGTVPAATEMLDPQLDQPVFHPGFGYGFVIAIDSDNVTFREKKDSPLTHTVKTADLITKSQAQIGLETCYFAGGAKAWRHAAGRWASLYKNLCLMEGKGVYGDWLKQHDLSRSSMDDLIRRFENEATWAAQEVVLPESGKTEETDPAPETPTGAYAVTGGSQVHERTPDPENDERQKNIQAETSKRTGIRPSHHKTILHLQRRNLDPERLALYYAIKADSKKRVDAIMQRKIDEGIEEVLALAPATPPARPEAEPEPMAEESKSATSAITEEVPAKGAPRVNDVEAAVRSALLNLGFKSADVKRVQFSPDSDFNQMMRLALQQLKPKTAENKGDSCTV